MLELQRVGSNCRDIAGELHRAQQQITTGGGHPRAEELEQDLARAASRSGVIPRPHLCCKGTNFAPGHRLPFVCSFLLVLLLSDEQFATDMNCKQT